jgi:hypothetical protein
VIFPFLPRALDGFVDFMNQYGPFILLGLILVSFVTNLPILKSCSPRYNPCSIFSGYPRFLRRRHRQNCTRTPDLCSATPPRNLGTKKHPAGSGRNSQSTRCLTPSEEGQRGP